MFGYAIKNLSKYEFLKPCFFKTSLMDPLQVFTLLSAQEDTQKFVRRYESYRDAAISRLLERKS